MGTRGVEMFPARFPEEFDGGGVLAQELCFGLSWLFDQLLNEDAAPHYFHV